MSRLLPGFVRRTRRRFTHREAQTEDVPLHSDFYRTIACITKDDPRFKREAYDFVLRALDYTMRSMNRGGRTGLEKHITGQELLEGVRELAQREFGLLARAVLESWGVHKTEDVGEIVFNLIDHQLLNRQDTDTRDDFRDGYDFEQVFEQDFDIALSTDVINDV